MSKVSEAVAKFEEACAKYGWSYSVRGEILTISKPFDGSLEEFARCDGEYYSVLSYAPSTRPGSIWGTDGGGVGAMAAMENKLFVMNKSGVNKRLLKALK